MRSDHAGDGVNFSSGYADRLAIGDRSSLDIALGLLFPSEPEDVLSALYAEQQGVGNDSVVDFPRDIGVVL